MIHLRSRRCVAAAFCASAIIASVAACGSQGGASALPTSAGGSTTSTGVSGTSSTSPTGAAASASQAAAQALAAYRGAFADWTAVEAIPSKADYQNPQLANHLTGAALSYVTGAVYVNTNVKGGVTHGQPVLEHPSVGEMIPASNPTQVVINDCVQTDAWLLYTTDGKLYNNTPGGPDKTQALVTQAGGKWKVSQLVIQKNGTC